MNINIVICTDTNYVMPCGVLFYSVCKNNRMHNIVFHAVIDESVTNEDKESLTKTVAQFGQKLEFHLVDSHLFDSFPNLGPGVYVSKATYYRLYLTEIGFMPCIPGKRNRRNRCRFLPVPYMSSTGREI